MRFRGVVPVVLVAVALAASLPAALTLPAAAAEPAAASAPGPLVSVLLGRSMWVQTEDCQAAAGQPTLDDVAVALASRGVAATGVVVPARTDEQQVTCSNGNLYPSWADLGRLRDQYGWSFVSNGQQRRNITTLPPAEQVEESCGSLDAFERHGHVRAWGMYGPGSNKITPAIATNVVGTCFAFVRYYSGTSVNTRQAATAPPYYVHTDDTNGGTCNRAPCTGVAAYRGQYRLPSVILSKALAAGPDDWVVLSTYKLLVGANLTSGDRRWDCSSADPLDHWTSEEESYCLVDLLAVLDGLPPGRVVTDPAGVAERWGRMPSQVRPPLAGAAPRIASLPQPLRTFGELTPADEPTRIVDTRSGLGVGAAAPMAAGPPLSVQVAGAGGVPATSVQQVVLNVTITGATKAAYVTLQPSGAGPTKSSSLNVEPGGAAANQVVVSLGPGGRVDVGLSAGRADVIVDVLGWITDEHAAGPGSRLSLAAPRRVLDTRAGGGRLGAGEVRVVQAVPPGQGITAVAFNLTAVEPTAATFLSAYPAGRDLPSGSNLNTAAGVTRANQVLVQVPPSGQVALFNAAGTTDVLVDVVGTYRRSGGGEDLAGRVVPLVAAERLVDTRQEGRPVVAGSTARWDLGLLGAAAGVKVSGALLNVTAVGASVATHVTVHAGDAPVPGTSSLNVRPGQAVPNAVPTLLGADATLGVTIGAGSMHVVIDASAVVLG